MNTHLFCPISKEKINEHVARLNALFTFAGITSFIISGNIFIVTFLAIDFLLRAFGHSNFSLMSIVSKGTVTYLKTNGPRINAGPKIFAARIGFGMSTAILLSGLLQLHGLAIGLSAVLGLFSLLEAAFGFCVACHVYTLLYKLGVEK